MCDVRGKRYLLLTVYRKGFCAMAHGGFLGVSGSRLRLSGMPFFDNSIKRSEFHNIYGSGLFFRRDFLKSGEYIGEEFSIHP
jgi:hypothetical protein